MPKTRVVTRGLKKRRAYRARVKNSPCRGKRGRTCNKSKNCKYTRGKKRKYCRKKKNRKLTMKGGKRKRRRSRKSSRKRKQRGGGCPYEKNMGEHFTLRPYNNYSGGDPGRASKFNSNNKVPFPYKKRRWKKKITKRWFSISKTGLGDLGQLYYSIAIVLIILEISRRGKASAIGGNVMEQPNY